MVPVNTSPNPEKPVYKLQAFVVPKLDLSYHADQPSLPSVFLLFSFLISKETATLLLI